MTYSWKQEIQPGAASVRVVAHFDKNDLKVRSTPSGLVLDFDGARRTGEPGTPAFPRQMIRIALPPQHRFRSIQSKASSEVQIGEGFQLVAPVQPPRPAMPREIMPVPPAERKAPKAVLSRKLERPAPFPSRVAQFDAKSYERAIQKAEPWARVLTVENTGMQSVVVLDIQPVHYTAKGTISFATELEIELLAEREDKAVPLPTVPSPLIARRQQDLTQALVLNRESLVGFDPDSLPARQEADYLIITDNNRWDPVTFSRTPIGEDLVAAFRPLVGWKRRKGLNTRLVTLSEIVDGRFGDFRSGSRDLQETLRRFLQWAHKQWGVAWVLLGGAVEMIPVRIVSGEVLGQIDLENFNPPHENKSVWNGSHLMMFVGDLGAWWPGVSADLPLVRVDTGRVIPYDASGTSSSTSAGWYFTTDASGATRSSTPTTWVRVNGPEAEVRANFRWLYHWNQIPTDLYYASLKKGPPGKHDWDANDNKLYGQYFESNYLDGQVYGTEVSVGRVPARQARDVSAFVEKLIAYEQFRGPGGAALEQDWARRAVYVSTNFGGKFAFWPTSTNPPELGGYLHASGSPYALLHLRDYMTHPDCQLWSVVSASDVRAIDYRLGASESHPGWYYAMSATDLTASSRREIIAGQPVDIPVPTNWIVVRGMGGDIAPQQFIINQNEADGSMMDEETLFRWMRNALPEISLCRRYYEDLEDLQGVSPAEITSKVLQPFDESTVRGELNTQGTHWLSLSGHGYGGGCCGLDTGWARSTANTQRPFIVYAASCNTNEFDGSGDRFSCELVNRGQLSGAIGYIGFTRFGWIGMGDDFQRLVFETLKSLHAAGAVSHLGLLNDVRCSLAPRGHLERWTVYAQNLLGDPEMGVWVGVPSQVQVSYARRATANQHFRVTVSRGPRPVSGATVCLTYKDRIIARGRTSSSGVADLVVNMSGRGTAEVTVTGRNLVPHLGLVEVREQLDDLHDIVERTEDVLDGIHDGFPGRPLGGKEGLGQPNGVKRPVR